MTINNLANEDRDVHRRGTRAARSLTGRVDYIRALLENVQTLITEAERSADADAKTRWAYAELGHLSGTVADAIDKARELHTDMMAKGLSPHALAAPAPPTATRDNVPTLVLRRGSPLMPIDTTLAEDDK